MSETRSLEALMTYAERVRMIEALTPAEREVRWAMKDERRKAREAAYREARKAHTVVVESGTAESVSAYRECACGHVMKTDGKYIDSTLARHIADEATLLVGE